MTLSRKSLITVLLALSTLGAVCARAEETQAKPGDDINQTAPRRGWFWYKDPPKPAATPKEPEVTVVTKPAAEPPKPPVVVVTGATKDKPEEVDPKACTSKDKWVATCGFVDPGDDFEFQSIQRDILLQQMSLRPDKPEAVEAAQRYMKWVVGKASQAANMWYFNMIQNPDLDPTVKNPISEIGISLAAKVKDASQNEYFRLIREEGGTLLYFSRADCSYCHDQAPTTRRIARTMGLQLINVPLDGKCLEGFEGDDCGDTIKPEQIAVLNVQTVPALYLYVPENTWIRLGTGIVSDQRVLANTVNFFSAYRAAMLAGLDNSKGTRPSVTFDPQLNAPATGTAPADGSQQAGAPSREKLMELMGYSKK